MLYKLTFSMLAGQECASWNLMTAVFQALIVSYPFHQPGVSTRADPAAGCTGGV